MSATAINAGVSSVDGVTANDSGFDAVRYVANLTSSREVRPLVDDDLNPYKTTCGQVSAQ